MKHLSLILKLLVISLFFISCSSDDDDPFTPPPNGPVTYTNTIAAIINGNCLNCHTNPPKNNAPMSLTTASEVESAIRTRGLIGKIEDGSMPPNGTLSATQIQAIKDWQAGGFIE